MTAHQQWASRPQDQRFQTLEELSQAVSARRMRSRASDVKMTDAAFNVTENGDIELVGVTRATQLSHWSFGQTARYLGAPAEYLRGRIKDNPELVKRNLNYLVTTVESTGSNPLAKLMVVDSEGDDSPTLQALTSPTYGRIWDADVADCTKRIVEQSDGKFYNPKAYRNGGNGFAGINGQIENSGLYASDRDIFIFMIDGGSVLDAGPRAQLNRGFFMWNSEVGSATFGLTTFLFNMVCGNHIIWGAQDVNEFTVRHTKNGPYRFDSQAYPMLKAYVESSAERDISVIRRAQDTMIPAGLTQGKPDFDQIKTFAHRGGNKFTKSELEGGIHAALLEEGDCRTAWQLTQGLTAHARTYEWVDARVDLERRAGKILNMLN